MKIKDVVALKEVSNDLNEGKEFYDQREAGVGDYFWDSLVADIESLIIYAGIHNIKYSFNRMLSKRFPYAVYYTLEEDLAVVWRVLDLRRHPDRIRQALEHRRTTN